jgi:hypothetical protein
VVVGLVWSEDQESYACGIVIGRASHAVQIKGDDPTRLRFGGEASILTSVQENSLLRSLMMGAGWIILVKTRQSF